MVFGLKQVLKSNLHPLVWERLGQAKQEYFWTKKRWHCDDVLIPIFKKYFIKSDGFYVDVGANDGRSCSNTYHLEKFQRWSGILVEPIMHIYFRSQQLRDPSVNKFFNAACVSDDYQYENIELLYSGLMSVINSEAQEYNAKLWAEDGSKFLSAGESVQKTWSQARTLESILIEAEAPRTINLLSIDVEGAEFGVLRGLDFKNWSIEYILIETNINSKSYEYLIGLGFIHIETIVQNLLFINSKSVNVP